MCGHPLFLLGMIHPHYKGPDARKRSPPNPALEWARERPVQGQAEQGLDKGLRGRKEAGE